MAINKELQTEILEVLSAAYPSRANVFKSLDRNQDEVIKNLLYLEENGLLESGLSRGSKDWTYVSSKINAAGLDFLADDGGLTATLGVVTVRLHDDTIKSLLEKKVMGSDLPQPDKRKLVDTLRELPADATKHLVTKLIDLGLEHAPMAGLIGLIGTAVSATPK